MKLSAFDYACPATVAEAVALLAAHGGEAKPIAGGQSLVPMLAFRLADNLPEGPCSRFLSRRCLVLPRGVEEAFRLLRIGA